jgi:ribosomal protein S18 acetylase RimI-like enzyme
MSNEDTRNIRIVPIAEEHIESYHQCLDSVARERLYLAFSEAPPLVSTREFVLSNITNDVPQFVAVRDGEVIGWCDISPNNVEGFSHCGRLGMGLHRDFRRLGIGQKLIAQTMSRAKEIGLERVELDVFASNTPAIKLYEKIGFVVEGIKKKACKIDGKYDDIVDMAIFI